MAMNFWEAQRRAKSKTTFYVVIFIILTISAALCAEYLTRFLADTQYNPPYPIVGLVFVGITFLVAGFQYMQFRAFGGSYVSESVGAYPLQGKALNSQEKQLMNIIEEIAIAAALPIPAVYVLETRQINAFAAGTKPEDSSITVTTGSLQQLNRDELQGVIAHEFGHIYNGDMKISLRLAAMVMAFFFILYFALRILQFSSYRRSNDKRGNPLVFVAIALIVAGAFTWLFGTLLKAAVSREREYLADACAVQFTRNPNGISNALKKLIKEEKINEMPKAGMAYSHLYFDDRGGLSALFATHPQLDKRIAAIEGREYIPEEWNIPL
jgi:heat shock protein HtpX